MYRYISFFEELKNKTDIKRNELANFRLNCWFNAGTIFWVTFKIGSICAFKIYYRDFY